MKNLIYLPFVLFFTFLATSCQKDYSAAKPTTTTAPSDTFATISLVNHSNTDYKLSFGGSQQTDQVSSGATNYTVDIPKNESQSISVKAGAYNIEVYPAGSNDYSSHSIAWGELPPVISPRANFNNVLIAAGSLQSLVIY